MENTLENKAKFFALYWGQEVFMKGNNSALWELDYIRLGSISKFSLLELKPLSLISDEDGIEGAIILQGIKKDNEILDIKRYDDFISFSIIHNGCNFKTCYSFFYQASRPATLTQKYADFLRSRGYALPWMGLSVEQLIEYGWIKLKED